MPDPKQYKPLTADDVTKLAAGSPLPMTAGQLSQMAKWDPVHQPGREFMFDNTRDEGFVPGVNEQRLRASNQTGTEQATNAVGRVLVNTIPTVIGNVASILDFEDYFNQDKEVGNSITRAMEDIKASSNENLPIYRENPGTPLDMGDPAWWAENGSSVAESAAAFAITGFGVGGILGKGAQGVKWLSTLGRSSQMTQGGTAGASLLNAVALNQAEAITTAIGVYDEIYSQALETSGNEELAKQQAADAASYSVNLNRANILLNLTSAAAFVKSAGSTRSLIKKFGDPRRYTLEAAQEYAEEDINLYADKAGRAQGKATILGQDYKEGFDFGELLDVAMSAEGVEAGLLGAFGGILQTGATDVGRRLLGRDQTEREKRQKQQAYIQNLESVFEQANIPNASLLVDFTKSIAPLVQAKEDIIKNTENLTPKDKAHISQIEDMVLAKQSNFAFKLGTTQSLIDMYDKIASMDHEEAAAKGFTGDQLNERSPEYYKDKARNAISKIETFENIYKKAQNYRNTGQVYENRIQHALLKNRVGEIESQIGEKQAELQEFYDSLPDYGVKDFKGSINPISFSSIKPETPKEKEALKKLKEHVRGSSLHQEIESLQKAQKVYSDAVFRKNEIYSEIISPKAQKEQERQEIQMKEDRKIMNDALTSVDQGASVSDLTKVKDLIKTPALKEQLEQIIKEKKEANKERVENTTSKGGTIVEPPMPPMDQAPQIEAPEIVAPEVEVDIAPPDVVPPEIEIDDIDAVFGAPESPFGPEIEDQSPVTTVEEEVIKTEIEPEKKEPEVSPRQAETSKAPVIKEDGRVKTRLKEYAGYWTEDEEGKTVFRTELNPDGTPMLQEYTNQDTRQTVPPSEVWESLEDGTLIINTPLVGEGTEVELVVEPDWAYWKSSNPVDVPVNVYRVIDGKRAEKPFTQLPRTDRTNPSTSQFREEVIKRGGLKTFISGKNIGDFLAERYEDGTRRKNSLSNLERDWVRDGDSWTMGSVTPILGLVRPGEGGSVMTFPNSQNIIRDDEQLEEDVNQARLLTTGMDGTVVTLRRSPDGRLIPAQVDPSRVTPETIDWLRNNLSSYLMERKNAELADVVHLPRLDSSSDAAFHNIEWGIVGNSIIFRYVHPETKEKGWIEIAAADRYGYFFDNFMKGKEFVYSVIDKNGNFKLQGSDRSKFFESKRLPADMKAEFKKQFDAILASRFRNINKSRLNTLDDFTDAVTGETYPNYFEFLKQTNSLTTDLPIGNSFGNASAYLKPVIEEEKTVKDTITKTEPEDKLTTPPAQDWRNMVDLRKFRKFQPVPGMKTVSQRELDWLRNKFDDDAIHIAKGVDKALSVGGIEAFGYYHDAMIHLAEMAEEGTGYHEAFHFVFDQQLDSKEKESILKDAAGIYKVEGNLILEEKLAEDFRSYMLSDGKIKPPVRKVRNLFERLWAYIKKALGFKSSIEKLFEDIAHRPFKAEEMKKFALSREKAGDSLIKFKLIPGLTAKAQQSAIQAATNEIMLLALESSTPSESIDELVVKNLDRYLQTTKKNFGNYFSILQQEFTASPSQDIANRLYILDSVLNVWDENFEKEIKKGMLRYGFTVTISGKTLEPEFGDVVDEQIAELREEDEQERVHDLSFTLRNPRSTLSNLVRRGLSTIPEYHTDEEGRVITDDNGNPHTVKTILGTPQFLDFNRVYSTLSIQLAGHKNIEERLEELAEKNSLIRAVRDYLSIRKEEGAHKFDGFYSQFMTNFNKYPWEFITVKYQRQNGEEIPVTLDTNRKSVSKALISTWRVNATQTGLITSGGDVNIKKASGLKARLDKLKLSSGLPYTELKDQFIKIAEEIGVEVPEAALGSIEQSKAKSTELRKYMFGKNSATLEQVIDRFSEGSNAYETESRAFQRLADLVKETVEEIQATGFIDEKGNQHTAINLTTYLSDKLTELKTKKGLKMMTSDKFYSPSAKYENKFISLLRDKDAGVEVKLLSALRRGNQVKDYTDNNSIDSVLTRIGYYHNNGANKAYISLGVLSDKKQQATISLPKQGDAREFIKSVLKGTVAQEKARIQRVKSSEFAKGIKSYSKGDKFLYIPELNQMDGLADRILDGEKSVEDILSQDKHVNTILDTFIEGQLDAALSKFEELGLISRNKEGKITTHDLPSFVNEKGVENFLTDFVLTDLAWRLEISKVLAGDIAFYKNPVDYVKRMYQVITPGLQPYVQPEFKSASHKKKIKRVVFNSINKINDEDYIYSLATLIDPDVTKKEIKEAIEAVDNGKALTGFSEAARIAASYRINNKTDAQAYSSIEFWRDQSLGIGQWTNDHEFLYQNAWKTGNSVSSVLTQLSTEEQTYWKKKEGELLLQPLKPFYFGDRQEELEDGSTMILKEQFKESITPLLPEWANKHKSFSTLLNLFQGENKVDIVSAEDAVKVGLYGSKDWTEITKEDAREFPASYFRYPLIIPTEKKANKAGTQLEKLILANIEPEGKYTLRSGESMTGTELIKDFHETWSELIQKSSDQLASKIGMKEDMNSEEYLEFLSKLRTILEEELINREAPDNFFQAIEDRGDGEFTLDLAFPAFGKRFEGILMNMFRKEVITQRFPGYSMVNLADYGTGTDDELKFVRNSGGKIVEAEVGMPYELAEKAGITDKHIGPNGKVIWSLLTDNQKKTLQVILYRIPTQGKNSAIPARVVRILPKSAGSVIMLPGEGTTQGGFDFDVDKSFMMFPTLDKEGNIDHNNPYNKLFDLHWSILTSPLHAEELLNPLDSDLHDRVITKLKARPEENGVSVFNVASDLNSETLAKYSKSMIGVFSKFSVAHATMQSIPELVRIDTPLNITAKGYSFDKVGAVRDNKGLLISNNHSMLQNSALDAQKDPKLGYLNIITFNAPTAAYMTSLGLDQETMLYFMNQPILKELIAAYLRGNSSIESATDAVTEKYPVVGSLMRSAVRQPLTPITVSNLKQMHSIENLPEYSAQILHDFREYYYAAQDMNKVNTALSTDTVRDFSGIAALLNFQNTVNYAIGPNTSVKIDKAVFDISKSPVKRVAAMYEYGIKRALNLAEKFYPYNTEGFNSTVSQIAIDTHVKDGLISDKDTIDLINQDTYNYLLSSGLLQIMNEFSPNYRERFAYANPASSMVVYFRKILDKHAYLQNNAFLRSLLPDPYNERNTIKLLTFNNTSSDMEKSLLVNGWEELLNSTEPDIKQFGKDLVRFAIETSGFKTGPNSFVDLVPVSFWVESGLADFQRTLTKAFIEGSAGNIDLNDASKFIVRMHPEMAPEVRTKMMGEPDVASRTPDLRRFEVTPEISGGLYSNHTLASWPRFARIGKRGDTRLYERQPDTLVYHEIQLLGEDYRYYQFAEHGDVKSKHPDHKGKSPTFKKVFEFDSGQFPDISIDEKLLPRLGLDQEGKTTVGEFLSFFTEVNSNTTLNEIAKKLSENIKDISRLPVRIDPTHDFTENTPAVYGLENQTILINPAFVVKGMDPSILRQVILHEVIHATTTKALFTPTTNEEQNFSRNMNSLFKDVKEELTRKYGKQILKEEKFYGLTSVQEFTAEIFSNPEFIREVDSVREGGFMRRLVRFIRKLLGLSVTADQTSDRAIQSLFNMVKGATRYRLRGGEQVIIRNLVNADELALKRTLNDMEEIMNKAVDRLKKKVSSMKSKFPESEEANQRLENAVKSLEDTEDKAKLVGYINVVAKDIGRLETRFKVASSENRVTDKLVNRAYDYLGGYSTIQDIRDYVGKHPEKYADIKTGDKTLIETLDSLNGRINRLYRDLETAQREIVAKWIVTTSGEKLDFSEVLEQLSIADRDVTVVNRLFDASIDSRDPLIRSVGVEVLGAWERARLQTEKLLRQDGGWLDVNQEYEDWLRRKGVSINDTEKRNSFILEERVEGEIRFVQREGIALLTDKKRVIQEANEIRANEALSDDVKTESIRQLWRMHFETFYEGRKVREEYMSEKWREIHKTGNEPLAAYYEMVVETYIRSQLVAPPNLRPGYRIPSIRKSMFEIVTDAKGLGKLRSVKEGVIDSFTRTYDELERQATDEQGNPLEILPVRFIARQDGIDGRPSTSEVSRDVASTVLMFIDQMHRNRELSKVVDTLELAKRTAAQRDVAKTKRKNLLTSDVSEVKDEQGYTITKEGTQSEAYKQVDTFIRRMVYGQSKKDEGSVNILGHKVDVAKVVDSILKYTGLRLLALNINLAVSNVATGETTMLKEAVGGKWFKVKDFMYGKKQFYKEVPSLMGDIGLRKPKSKLALVASLYNVLDAERFNLNLGKDTSRARKLFSTTTLGAPNYVGEISLKGSAMLAVMNTEKLTSPTGEEVNLYDAYEIKRGEAAIKEGYLYKGKPFTQKEFFKIRNKINKLNQLHGIYNRIDSSGVKETSVGRLVLAMRNWLKPGIDARFRTEYFDERLGELNEGHYVSAMKFFHQMFGKNKEIHTKIKDLKYLFGVGLDNVDFLTEAEKEKLTPQEQENLVELRKANVKKSLFEVYTITALSVLLMSVFGAGGDDDDSFVRYQLARLRRELTSFLNPVQAWEILKTPTVALSTVENGMKFIWNGTVGVATGEAFDTFESGPREGEVKILSNIKDNIPVWSQRTQFDRYDLKVNYMERGTK